MRTKKIIAMLFIAALTMGVNAQELGKANEVSEQFEKNNVPAVAIKVRGDQKLVIATLQDVLKKNKLKGKVSKNILKYEKITFPPVSNDYLNLYFKVTEIGEQEDSDMKAMVFAFVSRGANSYFIASQDDEMLINNMKRYLENNFYPQMQAAFVSSQTKMQSEQIKDTEKSISALESKIKGREKDIQAAQNNIAKYQKELEDSRNELGNQNKLLNQQKDVLRNIK